MLYLVKISSTRQMEVRQTSEMLRSWESSTRSPAPQELLKGVLWAKADGSPGTGSHEAAMDSGREGGDTGLDRRHASSCFQKLFKIELFKAKIIKYAGQRERKHATEVLYPCDLVPRLKRAVGGVDGTKDPAATTTKSE